MMMVDPQTRIADTNPATTISYWRTTRIRKTGFIEDRTSAEVWNQPIRGLINEEREVTIEEANTLIGVQPNNVQKHEESDTVAKGEWKTYGPYAVNGGDSIRVAMTGTHDADLHVRLGSAPTDAEYDCRPYGSNSVETCDLTASVNTESFYVSVKGYADSSEFELSQAVQCPRPTT